MSEQLQFEDEEVPITLRRAWDRALRLLATRVNKPTFETHIRAIRPLLLTEGHEENSGKILLKITLGVPSAFTREWVEKRHSSLIAGVLEEILDRDVQLSFALTPKTKNDGTGARAATLSLFDESEQPAATATATPAGRKTAAAAPSAPAKLPSPTNTPEAPKKPSAALQSALEPTNAPVLELLPEAPRNAPAPAHDAPSSRPKTMAPPAPAAAPTASTTPRSNRSFAEAPSEMPHLNARYTFDNFIVGPSNRLAHAGARAVAQAPGQVYNPLFLYGPAGLGKTHLMHAIANEIVKAGTVDPSRIAYISGEAFTSHFVTSIREHRTEDFRRKWRSVDLWLVDDIQFIAGKEKTNEEFFHTFNALYQTGKQIVICSDRSPRELRMMDDRLRSRFECGLIADVAPADLETRLAILHRKAESERMRIPDDVLLYMARLVQSNIRTLEGALVRLIAYASLVNSPVTTELAASVLERYYINPGIGTSAAGGETTRNEGTETPPAPPETPSLGRLAGTYTGYTSAARGFSGVGSVTPEIVQRVVARRFGMHTDALTGKRRDREVVNARQIAMHLMRELTEMSLPGIGQLFGGRDHSTVAHACDKVKAQMPLDEDLRSLIEDLALQVRAQASG